MGSFVLDLPPLNLVVEESEKGICEVRFDHVAASGKNQSGTRLFQKARDQLSEYLAGSRKIFDIELELRCSEFQLNVLELINNIPFGEVKTYSDLALEMGGLNQIRAVARAIATNPIPIFIPCHRVIGKKRDLRGYLGGEELKFWLLNHEGIILPGFQKELFNGSETQLGASQRA